MATAAAFQILANDGKTDKILTATDLLRQRICQITSERSAAGFPDVLPTIKDIERTHVIPFQSRFRPVVASAFEYQVMQCTGGTATFAGQATFDVAPFGEFITDCVLNINLSTSSYNTNGAITTASANAVLTGPAASLGTTASVTNAVITLPSGDTCNSVENVTRNGQALTIVRRLIYSKSVDEQGQAVNSGMTLADRVFYCDFPGEMIIKSCTATFCSNQLDKYYTEAYIFYRKTVLPVHKFDSYCRLMGQQVQSSATSELIAVDHGDGTPVSMKQPFTRGPQTPQLVQPALSLWIPLLFSWSDYRKPILCASIPSGQRLFQFEFCTTDQFMFRGPAFWQVCVLVEDLFSATVTPSAGTWTLSYIHNPFMGEASGGTGCVATVLYYPQYTLGTPNYPTFSNTTLYVNNIFTLTEIHDIYIDRIGFNLIRVHVWHTVGINTASQSLQLNNFKYPVEYFWFGIMLASNRTAPAGGYTPTQRDNRCEFWCKFTSPVRRLLWGATTKVQQLVYVTATSTPYASNVYLNGVFADSGITSNIGVKVASGSASFLLEETGNVTTFGVQVYAVDMFRSTASTFFSDYLPFQYGGQNIRSNDDAGIMFVNFTLTPGSEQPGSYINTSRAREFFVNYTSPTVGSVNSAGATIAGTAYAQGSAMNFILQTEGSVTIRYIT